MHPRVTLITLGISDLARSRRFYEALGFTAASASLGDVVFFQMAGGVVLALWPRQELAKDAQIPAADCGGAAAFSGISLAHNVRSAAEVDAVLDEAARGRPHLEARRERFLGRLHRLFRRSRRLPLGGGVESRLRDDGGWRARAFIVNGGANVSQVTDAGFPSS